VQPVRSNETGWTAVPWEVQERGADDGRRNRMDSVVHGVVRRWWKAVYRRDRAEDV